MQAALFKSERSATPEEEWRPVVGYEGTYSVSSLGRVRRERRGRNTWAGRVLKGQVDHDGYIDIGLWKDGKEREFFVHRLVAAAFIGPCPEGYEVNHKDGVKANNAFKNLEYVTRSENVKHAYRMGLRTSQTRRGETSNLSRLTETQVLEIRERYACGGASQGKLAAEYGVAQSCVCYIVNRKNWVHLPLTPGEQASR